MSRGSPEARVEKTVTRAKNRVLKGILRMLMSALYCGLRLRSSSQVEVEGVGRIRIVFG